MVSWLMGILWFFLFGVVSVLFFSSFDMCLCILVVVLFVNVMVVMWCGLKFFVLIRCVIFCVIM